MTASASILVLVQREGHAVAGNYKSINKYHQRREFPDVLFWSASLRNHTQQVRASTYRHPRVQLGEKHRSGSTIPYFYRLKVLLVRFIMKEVVCPKGTSFAS